MKPNIHPQTNPAVFVDLSTGDEFITRSTMTSEKKREINGVEHFEIPIEISSASHPFYTGQERFVDTSGRVDKFKARMERVKEVSKTRGGKKAKRADRAKKEEEIAETSDATKATANTEKKTATKAVNTEEKTDTTEKDANTDEKNTKK